MNRFEFSPNLFTKSETLFVCTQTCLLLSSVQLLIWNNSNTLNTEKCNLLKKSSRINTVLGNKRIKRTSPPDRWSGLVPHANEVRKENKHHIYIAAYPQILLHFYFIRIWKYIASLEQAKETVFNTMGQYTEVIILPYSF